ncbi:MAG: ACR3 family arsenite efflux transporter [Pseudomonadales bacterium]
MPRFKAWLSVWIGLAMLAGLGLGLLFPDTFRFLGSFTVANVNPVTAVLVWFLIFPTMVQIDYSRLRHVWLTRTWYTGSLLTTSVNWLIKPFSMAVLAVVFLKYLFAPWLNADPSGYIAGLILLGVAPCTGMVFVWSRMTNGDTHFTLAQVALNDVILLFAFVPVAGVLLGISGIEIPWRTLGLSTFIYVVVPLLTGYALQKILKSKGEQAIEKFDNVTGSLTKTGLLLLVVLLFGFQSQTIVERPLIIALIAVPVIVQTFLIFFLTFGAGYLLRLPTSVAGPAALIGTSNFFELAVAIAITVFGIDSDAVVATVVGVLVEVPVMLLLVAFINRSGKAVDAHSRPLEA